MLPTGRCVSRCSRLPPRLSRLPVFCAFTLTTLYSASRGVHKVGAIFWVDVNANNPLYQTLPFSSVLLETHFEVEKVCNGRGHQVTMGNLGAKRMKVGNGDVVTSCIGRVQERADVIILPICLQDSQCVSAHEEMVQTPRPKNKVGKQARDKSSNHLGAEVEPKWLHNGGLYVPVRFSVMLVRIGER